MLYSAFAPAGQHKSVRETAEKEARDFKKGKPVWNYELPSFEVWAASLCFDDTDPTGGATFQSLMQWALTNGTQKRGIQKPQPPRKLAHYVAEARRGNREAKPAKNPAKLGHRGQWTFGTDRYRGTNLAEHVRNDEDKTHSSNAYSDPNFGLRKEVGGNLAIRNDQTRGFEHVSVFAKEKLSKENAKARQFQAAKTTNPHGVLQFYLTAGMTLTHQTKGKEKICSYGQNMSVQKVGRGSQGEGNKAVGQDEGCPSIGNRLAMYYGLYYYPNCNDEIYNWHVTTTVGGTDYKIRMRLPNPAYEFDGRKCVVREPLNTHYWTEDNKFIGSTDGTYFPQMSSDDSAAQQVTPYDFLALRKTEGKKNQENHPVSRISPWAGRIEDRGRDERAEWGDTIFWYETDNSGADLHDSIWDSLEPRWKTRFYQRDDYPNQQNGGLAFGWTPCQALLLWPHAEDKEVRLNGGGVTPGYQEWPTWKEGTARWDFMRWDQKRAFIDYLQQPPLTSERQKAALGLDFQRVKNADELWRQLNGEVIAPVPDAPIPQAPEAPLGNPKLTKAPAEDDDEEVEDPPDDVAGQIDARGLEKPNQNLGDALAGDDGYGDTRTVSKETLTGGSVYVQSDIIDSEETVSYLLDARGEPEKMDVRAGTPGKGEWERKNNLEVKEPPLKPGSRRRRRDTTGNTHFFSLSHSPWPPTDVYTEPKHEYEFEVMTGDEKDRYEELYGNVANLVLRHSTPHRIKGVKQTFGEVQVIAGKRILDMRLDSYRSTDATLPEAAKDVFRKNMRRILSIYHDDSGVLGTGKEADRYDPKKKRQGMKHGLWGPGGDCKEKGSCTVVLGPEEPKKKKQLGQHPLIPPVFGERQIAPKGLSHVWVFSEETLEVLGDPKAFTRDENGTRGLWSGERGEKGKAVHWAMELDADVDGVVSEMTVLEWLQSPWHYEYLPYRPMTSVFKDGETYCSGCTRCSRPYYEYEYQYAWYLNAEDKTKHWPYTYWRPGSEGQWDFRYAPLPFHDPRFWSEPRLAHKVYPIQDSKLGDVGYEPLPADQRGYHNWKTKVFLLGWKDRYNRWGTYAKDGKLKGTCEPTELCGEFCTRMHRNSWIKDAHKSNVPWTFREYINHLYDPKEKYDKFRLVQGVMRSKRSKVAYGMSDYRLQRSVKYGNVCRDCAATLDLAPGLYERTGRSTVHYHLASGGQSRREDALGMDTWWLGLKDKPLLEGPPDWKEAHDKDGNVRTFDPWFIFLETSQDKAFHHYGAGALKEVQGRAAVSRRHVMSVLGLANQDLAAKMEDRKSNKWAKYKALFGENPEEMVRLHLNAVERYTHARACHYNNTAGKPMTKVTTAEVFVQKTWNRTPEKWTQIDSEQIRKAKDVLKEIIDWLDKTFVGGKDTLTLKPGMWNRALRDMMHETHYELARRHAYLPDPDKVKVFDPNMTREEWRNYEYTDAKGYTWRNCLRTSTLQRPNLIKGGAQVERGEVPEGAYVTKVYHCTRAGEFGDDYGKGARWANTDWRGDGYILKHGKDGKWTLDPNAKNNIPPKAHIQTRRLTQTRVFITYSLHRRIQSEMEARHVMEKMADAVRTLFGNDEWLCQVVVFGQKLRSTGSDTVSSKTYAYIQSARKDTTIFYGDVSGNSYVYDTYQTHVDSVTVDAGIEIGPTYHMPHFHALVTLNHWSYMQVDTMRMKALLEQMFKGTGRFPESQYGDQFKLLDAAGLPFYTDNENPYVDIRIYPSDNWAEVISAYVRKSAQPGIFEAQRVRTGDVSAAT